MTARRYVYFFGNGHADGTREMKSVLGGKGANLAEMTNLGVPVPPGIHDRRAALRGVPRGPDVSRGTARRSGARTWRRLEEVSGKRFGDPDNPLLVSVRSGGAVSMPGMMETILNLGPQRRHRGRAWRAAAAIHASRSTRYRRFLQMYGDVVLERAGAELRAPAGGEAPDARRRASTPSSTKQSLRTLVEEYKLLIRHDGRPRFPAGPASSSSGARSKRSGESGCSRRRSTIAA